MGLPGQALTISILDIYGLTDTSVSLDDPVRDRLED